MKTQIFQNWFKLMIGTSALIVSVSFLIRSISPVYANNLIPTNMNANSGYVEGGYIYVFFSEKSIMKIKVGQMENFLKFHLRKSQDMDNDGWNNTLIFDGLGKPIRYYDKNYKIVTSNVIQWWQGYLWDI